MSGRNRCPRAEAEVAGEAAVAEGGWLGGGGGWWGQAVLALAAGRRRRWRGRRQWRREVDRCGWSAAAGRLCRRWLRRDGCRRFRGRRRTLRPREHDNWHEHRSGGDGHQRDPRLLGAIPRRRGRP